jgi:hypothetical protein
MASFEGLLLLTQGSYSFQNFIQEVTLKKSSCLFWEHQIYPFFREMFLDWFRWTILIRSDLKRKYQLFLWILEYFRSAPSSYKLDSIQDWNIEEFLLVLFYLIAIFLITPALMDSNSSVRYRIAVPGRNLQSWHFLTHQGKYYQASSPYESCWLNE